jgi:hypothetical protein
MAPAGSGATGIPLNQGGGPLTSNFYLLAGAGDRVSLRIKDIGDGTRLRAFVDEIKKDVDGAASVVMHRINYGSPPLFDESEDVTVSPIVSLSQKQKRIQRRRALLGLPYEPWTGGTY